MRSGVNEAAIKRRPRIVYWTTACLEPRIEAVSKEVVALANHFRPSFIFSTSPHISVRFSARGRFIGFHLKFYPFLRLLVPLLEQWADINHVYGEVSPWLYHKTLRKKPIIHTIASEKGTLLLAYLERCSAITVQTDGMLHRLTSVKTLGDRVKLVYPGVDLSQFVPAPTPPSFDRVRLLFASAPRTAQELFGRGIPLIIGAAKLEPRLDVRLLFRPWAEGDTALQATRRMILESGVDNVKVSYGFVSNMARMYSQYHFTVIPWMRHDGGKELPNSLVESIACGVPVIITSRSPAANFVAREHVGVVCPSTSNGIITGVSEGVRNYDYYRGNAYRTRSRFFDISRWISKHREIYGHVLKSG